MSQQFQATGVDTGGFSLSWPFPIPGFGSLNSWDWDGLEDWGQDESFLYPTPGTYIVRLEMDPTVPSVSPYWARIIRNFDPVATSSDSHTVQALVTFAEGDTLSFQAFDSADGGQTYDASTVAITGPVVPAVGVARPSVGRLVAPRPGGGTINTTVESLSGLQWSAGTEDAFVIPADATLTQIQVTTVTPTGNPTTWVQVGEVTGIDGGGNPIPASDVYVTGPFTGYTDTVSQFYPTGSVLAVAAGANFGATSRLTVRLTFSTGIAAELPMWVQFAI